MPLPTAPRRALALLLLPLATIAAAPVAPLAAGTPSAPAVTAPSKPAGPPPTRTVDFKEVLHGVEIADPYRWLEDQESAETRQWIAAQNAYAHSLLGGLPARGVIRARLQELLAI